MRSLAFGSEPTPARPGPGPLPDALLRALDVSIGRKMQGLLAGDYRSALLGDGTELAQVRPYVPGDDDVRRIDWNVTARTSVPHVRVHLAERAAHEFRGRALPAGFGGDADAGDAVHRHAASAEELAHRLC